MSAVSKKLTPASMARCSPCSASSRSTGPHAPPMAHVPKLTALTFSPESPSGRYSIPTTPLTGRCCLRAAAPAFLRRVRFGAKLRPAKQGLVPKHSRRPAPRWSHEKQRLVQVLKVRVVRHGHQALVQFDALHDQVPHAVNQLGETGVHDAAHPLLETVEI